MTSGPEIERHPWEPFIPEGAKLLFLGTFPPKAHRWAMDFYYPNPTNDFWRIMGLLFFGHKDALYDTAGRSFRLDGIKALLTAHGIAMSDTARAVRRLHGNASDKYLEIVEPLPLDAMLAAMPLCRHVASTGEKAASVIAQLTDTELPAMGKSVPAIIAGREVTIWRMPSTSRAYPLALERKAEFYSRMLAAADIQICGQ